MIASPGRTKTSKDKEDMSSQLNPDAAEFVPVSPTRELMMDEAIIIASPPMPSSLYHSNSSRHGDDYFQRDNFSTLSKREKDFNSSLQSNVEFIMKLKQSSSDTVSFDKTEGFQKMEENVTSSPLEKANALDSNEYSNNTYEEINSFGNSDSMMTIIDLTTSPLIDLTNSPVIDLTTSSDPDELNPGTPKLTAIETPGPSDNWLVALGRSISPCNHEMDCDLRLDTLFNVSPYLANKSEENEFIIKCRRSIDLSFKPTKSFSDTNSFGALHQSDIKAVTPKEEEEGNVHQTNNADLLGNTLSSFICEQQLYETIPSNELYSPKEDVHFLALPFANSSIFEAELTDIQDVALAVDLTSSPVVQTPQPEGTQEQIEPLNRFTDNFEDVLFPLYNTSTPIIQTPQPEVTQEQIRHQLTCNRFTDNFADFLFPEDNEVIKETSFITTGSELTKVDSSIAHVDLDLTLDVEKTELVLSNIGNVSAPHLDRHGDLVDDEIKTVEPEENKQTSYTENITETVAQPYENENIYFAFDEQKKEEFYVESEIVNKFENETTNIKLEFESHTSSPKTTSDDLKEIDEGFEVISKDELKEDVSSVEKVEQSINLTSSVESKAMRAETSQPLTPADDPQLMKRDEYTTETDNLDIHSEGSSTQMTKEPSEEMVENKLSKIEPVQSQEVSKMLITTLEEKIGVLPFNIPVADKTCEPPRPTMAVLPDLPTETVAEQYMKLITETFSPAERSADLAKTKSVEESHDEPGLSVAEPPPTPTPGLDQHTDAEKGDILAVAAAVAVAGAVVAVGPDAVVDKKSAAGSKTPAQGVKKPTDSAPKAALKAVPAKAPATLKPSAAKPVTSKPAATTMTTKAAATKTTNSLTPVKKPATGPTTATKTASGAAVKPMSMTTPKPGATSAQEQPPKQLSVNKTTPTIKLTSKPSSPTSKPSTPTSNPTTPTMPKSPMIKPINAKSPPKPIEPTTTTRPVTNKVGEKPNLTNGDIKPLVKKPATTTATKLTAKPSVPAVKTSVSSAKPMVTEKPAVPGAKTTPAKPSAAKTTVSSTTPVLIKRSTTTEDKSKPTVNGKTVPTTEDKSKPTVNGKTVPTTEDKSKPTVNGKTVPTTEDKSKPTVNGKTVPTTEDKSKPTVNVKTAHTTEDKSKPTVNGKTVPTTEDKSKPTVNGKTVPTTEDKSKLIVNGKTAPTTEDKSKPTVNGKVAPKTVSGVKKTDTKIASKNQGKGDSKMAPVKKPKVIEHQPTQESEVTTSNLRDYAEPTPVIEHV